MQTRITIVEDDRITRENITAFLAATPDFLVIGSFGSSEEALQLRIFIL
jgi:DNA-binding NarL/FixJ family response regulator